MRIIHNQILTILLIMLCNFNTSAQQIKTLTKIEVSALYNKLYKSSKIDSIEWNGQEQKCLSGQLQENIYKKAEDRINFFRIASGLNEVKLNPKFNLDAQNAALFVKANNKLTHFPKKQMKCYSESAANGCIKSCLGFTDFANFQETSFITGFIQDFGEDNYFVGHRKWILYTKLVEFGYGATDKTEALLTADGISNDSISAPEFIAYPWNGYVPVNLIFPKWSFSIPENKIVDFSQVTISMFDSEGKEIKTEMLKEFRNYLDHTIVWTAKGLFTDYDIQYGLNKLEENGFLDKKIKVLIQKVKIDGSFKQYEYFVEPFKI